MNKIWDWLKIALGIIFSVLIYVFLTKKDNRRIKKVIDKVNKEVNIEKTKIKKIEKRVKKRKEKTELRKGEAEILNNKLKKYFKERRDK